MFFDRKPAQGPQEDLANLKITDARLGDTLSVNGAAEDFSDVDFTVDRNDQYEAGSSRWSELSGPWRDRALRSRSTTITTSKYTATSTAAP